MKFEAEGDLKLQLDLFLNHGLNLHDNFEKPVELGIETAFNQVEYTWPDSNPSDQGILFNPGDGALSWVERISNAKDTLDVLISLGLLESGGPLGYYGEIYATDLDDELTIASSGQANRIQITTFNSESVSAGMTLDLDNDQIIIENAGVYKIIVDIAVIGIGGTSARFGFAVYKNTDTELFNIHAHRQVAAGGGDVGSVAMEGLVRLVLGDTIRVYVWNEDNTSNVVIDDISLSIVRIGT